MSDRWGLEAALTAMPLLAAIAAVAFMAASRTYESETPVLGGEQVDE